MMLSLTNTLPSGIHTPLQSSSPLLPPQKLNFGGPSPKPTSIFVRPNTRNHRFFTCAPPAAAATESPAAVTAEAPTDDPVPNTSKEPSLPPEPLGAKVAVKTIAKPRLVLKFIWMEKNIGLALDQLIPGHGTIPLSPYYFWPRKDAWEELKNTLESKPWISQKTMIILLNQATDIINLWQQSGGTLPS